MLRISISDNLEASWLEADEKYHLADFFNRKIFRISDSTLTYRQINNLEASGLFKSGRADDSKWRLLSFKDILYMELVNELRKFGYKNNQLVGLRDIFYGPIGIDESSYRDWSLFTSDLIIGACFGSGQEIILSIKPDGEGCISNIINYIFFESGEKSQIILKLNDFVNTILVKIGKKPFPIKIGLNNTLLGLPLTNNEENLINKMRESKAKSITVKMKNGEPDLAHFYFESQGNMNKNDVLKQLDESNFQDIRVVKRDGKIVNIKKEQVIKLNSTEQKNNAGRDL